MIQTVVPSDAYYKFILHFHMQRHNIHTKHFTHQLLTLSEYTIALHRLVMKYLASSVIVHIYSKI